VHFVRKHKDKAAVCRGLGITRFVDDRLDVLGRLDGVVAHRILLTGGSTAWVGGAPAEGVRRAASWPEVAALLERDLAPVGVEDVEHETSAPQPPTATTVPGATEPPAGSGSSVAARRRSPVRRGERG